MKRVFKLALVIVPLALIAVIAVLLLSLNGIVKGGVEGVLPQVLGVPVKLETVKLSPFSGKGTLTGFIIGNPEGFKTDHAFALGTVRVNVDVLSLFSNTIVIEEIYIESPQVTYEIGLSGSNIGTIQENIAAFAGPSEEEPEQEPEPVEDQTGKAKKIQINHFVFKDGKVSISTQLLSGQRLTAPIPDIELKDIGKGGGSVADVARVIAAPVTGAVNAAANKLKDLVRTGAGAVGKAGKTVLDAGKKAVSDPAGSGKNVIDAGKKVLDGGKKTVDGAVKNIKKLFD